MSTSVPISPVAPVEEEFVKEEEARVMVASQWAAHLVESSAATSWQWWPGVVAASLYAVALFAEFFEVLPPDQYAANYTYAPPQRLHIIDNSSGSAKFGLYVNGYKVSIDAFSLRRNFVVDPATRFPVTFFAHGFPYKLLGFLPTDIHIIGPVNAGDPVYLLGADSAGRDLLSKMIAGGRVSLSIGLLGVTISLVLGILLGGVSGYYGGAIDNVIQRIIEFLRSLPTIPLWMSLAAALPVRWPPMYVYFGITVILSFIGWTGLARVVRGRFLALREEDFVLAARLDGSSQLRIILHHMVPSFNESHHCFHYTGHPRHDSGAKRP